ncbi:MAG TPA: hypothetical protein VHC22_22700 [Pirellulales bacterium]|nr:hypothetical protein [Pirellulales bacterium]
MSSHESDSGTPPRESSNAGTIVLAGIVALGVTWTYIFFGIAALQWWAKGAATVVIFPLMFGAWRWRKMRERKQIEMLQRWADEDDAKSKRRRPPR